MTQVAGTYGALTARDLGGFDPEPKALVLSAIERGAIGRMSARGHVILRSPDGIRTAAVARKFGWNRSGDNARAEVDRLFADVLDALPPTATTAAMRDAMTARDAKPVAAPKVPAPAEPEAVATQQDSKPDHRTIPDGILRCADCGWETLWKRGLARHRQTRHGDLSRKEADAARGGKPLPRHATKHPTKAPVGDAYRCGGCAFVGASRNAVGGHQSHSGHAGIVALRGGEMVPERVAVVTAKAPTAPKPPAAPAASPEPQVRAEPVRPAAARTEAPTGIAAGSTEALLLLVRQTVAPDLLATVADLRLRLAVVTAERDEARRLLGNAAR